MPSACVLCQMTMPGAPCIYYGDEIGMSTAKDPFCRAAFPWQDQGQWDHDLMAFYCRATACDIATQPCGREPFSACTPAAVCMLLHGHCRSSARW